ncbi:hypothetical protein WN944_008916 [Citrus x changshan-huyou]|uniref:Methyltransferase n=1 Tax=Citrus x changshan-huyou TaxID=2935761 RepID=A0AAP0MNV6_9ROSI
MDSLALFCTGALLAGGLYWFVCVLGPAEQKGKRAVNLSGGSISAGEVEDNYKEYWKFFKRPKETTKEKVPDFVDTFYNLVTDIYEWGWGQSFHFSPSIPGKSHRDATRLHEEMAVHLIDVKAGDCILDVGCGVGGPMRAIAAHSRANVVGITINEYQVNRARLHNKKAGLDSLCEVVCGNFLKMPFEDNHFDGAYSIEATCHAPKLEDVYAEVFRVLKPGSLYVSYEWVTTDKYEAENKEHVDIIQGIERGDALPGLRSYAEITEIAKRVGFEVVKEKDLAKPPAQPWWTRLKMGRVAYWRNHILVTILAALGIAPKGTVGVHDMLFKTADYLTRGEFYELDSIMGHCYSSYVSALLPSHPWKHSSSIQSNANSISEAWSRCGWILALHSMAVVTNFILKLPLSLSASPKFTPLRSPHSLFSPPIFAKPQSLTKPKTSRTQLLITKATAAPGTKNAPRDERVKKVHSIEEFDEALRLAKNKLVVVEFAASRSLDSSKIYPFMVDLSRQCNDVEFILVMGDESEKTKELCEREKIKKVPHFSFYKSMEKIHEEEGIGPDQLMGDVLYYGDSHSAVVQLHSKEDVEKLIDDHKVDQKLIVLDVGLKHCGPCVKVYPTVIKLSRQMAGTVVFARMNGDENDSCMQFLRDMNVVEVPTFLFIRDGQIRGRYVGSGKGELIGEILRYQGVRVTY